MHLIKSILFLLITFSLCPIKAQKIKNVDSLFNEYSLNLTKENLTKIIDLNAKVSLNKNFDEYLKLFEKSERLITKEEHPSLYAELLESKSRAYLKLSDTTNALKYINLALNLEFNNDKKIALIISKADIYNQNRDYDKSLLYFKKAYHQAKSIKDEYNEVVAQTGIGNAYSQIDSTEIALDHLFRAKTIAMKNNFSKKLFFIQNIIAHIQTDNENYNGAITTYTEMLSLKDSLELYLTCECCRGLAVAYSRNEEFEKAIKTNNAAIECYKTTEDKYYIQEVYLNQSSALNQNSMYLNAIQVIDKGLELVESQKTYFAKLPFLNNKIISLTGLNRSQEALDVIYLMQNDTNCSSFMDEDLKQRMYSNLAQIYSEQNKMDSAFYYLAKSNHLKDSINKSQNKQEIIQLTEEYESEFKEQKILSLEKEKELEKLKTQKANNKILALIITTSLLLLILIISIIAIRKRKKQNNQIKELHKELHHRTKNNLAIISAFIKEAQKSADNDLVDISKIKELQTRVTSIYEVHNLLLKKEFTAQTNIKEYIETLIPTIQKSFTTEGIKILVSGTNNALFNNESIFPLGLIVNEFITNSIKHAFKEESENKTIEINLNQNKNTFSMVLKDSGVGFDIKQQSKKSYGLKLIKLMAAQINAKANFVEVPQGSELKVDITLN